MNRLICVSIFIALVIAGRVSAQQPARSRDITGRVFNHNGQPLAGEKVFMEKLGSRPRDSRETYTNDAGEFRFDNLSSGIYSLSAGGVMDGDLQQFYRPGDVVTFRIRKGAVITGVVTDSTGEPVIAARVRTLLVRDEQGHRISLGNSFYLRQAERLTDDRGVYRFWGLAPGFYLVSVGGKSRNNWNRIPGTTDDGAPTYHPSAATPEAATEVSVQGGQEATGIDIRYRGESGYAVSGYIFGQVASGSQNEGTIVMLTQAATGLSLGWQAVQATDSSSKFVFEGLADGEYDLMALRIVDPNIVAASPNRRVIVKGKDASGAELKLAPLGSIEGRITLEAVGKPRCQSERKPRLDEMMVIVNKEGGDSPLPNFTIPAPNVRGALVVPDQRGDFAIRSLKDGHYRVEAQLPSEDWYIRSINLPRPAQPGLIDAGREGITVKSGERVTGVTISIQEGAALLRGRVISAQASATSQAGLRVHLVPAERKESDNALRFAEAAVESDGSFFLTNIAPGRYWLLARPADDSRDDSIPPLAWDREARAKLIREAAAANNPIDLQPCQRIADRILRYAPPATSDPKKM